MYTNINIKGTNYTCTYMVDYDEDSRISRVNDAMYQILSEGEIVLSNTPSSVVRNKGNWEVLSDDRWNHLEDLAYLSSTVTLYFPLFSVDVYNPNVIYSLNAETWINGKKIILGSWRVKRIDAIASSSAKRCMGQDYYECIEFSIIDPHFLMYGDEWKHFRSNVCGEKYNEDGTTLNNTGSVLYFSLHPVELTEENNLVDCEGWVGGQNSINTSREETDNFLTLHIKSNTDEPLIKEMPSIKCKILFNEVYEGNLKEYLKETYNIQNCSLRYGIVIGNEDDLYFVGESELVGDDITTYSFTKNDILSGGNFTNWIGWKPGIDIVCSLDVLSEDGDPIIYLLSNPIPLTQELYKYFVKGDWDIANKSVYNVNLNLIDMKVYNNNIVNKIDQSVVQMSRHTNEDSKKNIIQPVFFRVSESQNIILHPVVVENISINLDEYKSKVKSFKLKIGDVTFVELGRVDAGVLFKIVGNKLPKDVSSGNYYILDESGELVTTGKYKYSV